MTATKRTKRTVENEQYFTSHKLAVKCVDKVKELYPFKAFDLILEPSAGAGAFYDLLPKGKRLGLDIDPQTDEIIKQDFFKWTAPSDKKILTIGNPPFGQRGKLAVEFTNKSCEFSDIVAFIVPRSFKKDTFLNRIHKNFHLVYQDDCDEFVLPDGTPTKVKSVFQIWERRDEEREIIVRASEHADFEMKHAHIAWTSEDDLKKLRKEYTFAIAQVGSNFKPKDVEDINKGSYWFIKANKTGVRKIFEKLDFSFLDGMNTAFTSLSKKDIIQAYITAKTK